eukprot:COSAG02_NODE_634_length_19259_cov_9.871347_9_plen_70_part_00
MDADDSDDDDRELTLPVLFVTAVLVRGIRTRLERWLTALSRATVMMTTTMEGSTTRTYWQAERSRRRPG